MRSRLASLTAAGVFGAAAAIAQPAAPAAQLTRVEGPALTVGEVFARMSPRVIGSPGFEPKVILNEKADVAFLIPAAGSVQGAGNTYFRSDFMVGSLKSSTQRIGIAWIAQGVDNSNAPLQFFTIGANKFAIEKDIVGNLLGESGLGSLLVFGATPSGDLDLSAQLLGFSRIWSNQPNASGTVSLQFPAVSPDDSIGSAHAYALGLRHDGQYRTNVGIVNLDSFQHTWTVRIVGFSGSGMFNVTVKPYSMMQVPLPSGTYGDLFLDLQASGSGFSWSGYGASVDNITGDGWVARAVQP